MSDVAPAATATPAAPAADPAAPVVAPAAAPAVDPAAPPAADPAKAPEPAAKPKEAEPAGAPEAYEAFKLPENLTLDETLMGDFGKVAKELNLPQEAAQKLVDIAASMQAKTVQGVQDAMNAQAEAWEAETSNDKEVGGTALQENLAVAKTAMEKFFPPDFAKFLEDTKLGSHPAMVKGLFRVGKAISQDGFVPGRQGNTRPSHADVLYAKH